MVIRGTTGGKCYRLLPEKENTDDRFYLYQRALDSLETPINPWLSLKLHKRMI